MKLVKKVLIGAVLLQMLTFIAPMNIFACDCDIPKDALAGMEKSDAVFAGLVKKKKKTNINDEGFDEVFFEVHKIWKGLGESQAIIYTTWSSCQYDFKEGKEYLVYSYKKDDRYYAINCGRTTSLTQGKEDIHQLGLSIEPIIFSKYTEKQNNKLYIAIFLIVILISSICMMRYLKKRKEFS